MTSLDRMLAALHFDTPDRVPVFLNNTCCAARLAGASIRDVTLDGERLAEALLASYRRFGYDGIRVGTDVTVEAEAMGCKVKYPENDVAAVTEHVLRDLDDLGSLKPPNPRTDGRMPQIVKATELVAREVADEAYILSLVMGPVNLASQLMGVSDLILMMMDEPEQVEKLLDLCGEVTVAFGTELVKAGAHGVAMGEAVCSVSMLGPNLYREFAQPVHKKTIDAFKSAGIDHTVWHICGGLEPIIEDVSSTGALALELDTQVDMVKCRELLGKKSAFIGNVSTSLLLSGTPDEVDKACVEALRAKDGGGFILSAGCAMARDTGDENIAALVAAAQGPAGQY